MASSSEKNEGAFRTIREVADWLGVPTHVLRFWESKFDQISPVKGAGGRRYYRPDDMRLLGGIKVMLHDRGLTIRGVAQQIDADGIEAVTALSPELEATPAPAERPRKVIRQHPEPAGNRVVPFDRGANDGPAKEDEHPTEGEPDPEDLPPERPAPDAPAQPDAPTTPAQPDEPATPGQPDDTPIEEPDPPPQPDVPDKTPEAPDLPPQAPSGAPTARATGLRVETALDRRRLRRVVRRLRTVIEDVEAELSQTGVGPDS